MGERKECFDFGNKKICKVCGEDNKDCHHEEEN